MHEKYYHLKGDNPNYYYEQRAHLAAFNTIQERSASSGNPENGLNCLRLVIPSDLILLKPPFMLPIMWPPITDRQYGPKIITINRRKRSPGHYIIQLPLPETKRTPEIAHKPFFWQASPK